MRVLLVASMLPGDARPGAPRVSWLLRGLPSHGIETHLLSLRHPRVPRADSAGPAPTDSVTVIPNTCRERAGYWAALFGRDGGFRRGVVTHPSQVEAVRKGLDLVERLRPDFVLSTSPPTRIAEVAYRITLETGVPWLSDWRDPATLDPLGVWLSRRYYGAAAERERLWLGHATANVVTAPSYAKTLASHFPGIRVEVVTNSFEPGDVDRATSVSPGTLLYSGSAAKDAYGFASKHPSKLSRRLRRRFSFGRLCYMPFAGRSEYHAWGRQALRAMARVKDRISALLFRGTLARETRKFIRRLSLAGRTRLLPWTTPEQVRRDMAGAHVLWMCLAGTSRTEGESIVMAKVFNYLASGRPIFAALPPECDTAAILRAQPGVFLPDPADDRAMDEALEEALSLPPDRYFERDLDAYRRDRLAERMAGILRGALSGRYHPPVGGP